MTPTGLESGWRHRVGRSLAAIFGIAAVAAALATQVAAAPAYPSKPITLIVPFPPGGAVDVTARILAGEMRADLGQEVVVSNHTGAGGTIGVTLAAKADPDGYTIALGASPNTSMAFLSKGPVPYTFKDLSFIAHVARTQFLLVARNDFPASTPAQMLQLSARQTGKFSFGDTTLDGIGAVPLTFGYLGKMAGSEFLRVPYRGEAPILSALMSGELDLSIITYTAALPQIRAGKIKAIAGTSKARYETLPELPTVAETLIPRYESGSSLVLIGPAKMPPEAIAKLNAAVNKALANPAVQKRMDELGLQRTGGTPAEAATFIAEESRAWECVIAANDANERPPRSCF